MLTDPYTFTEFEDAMHAVVDRPVLSPHFRILIDRRGGGRFTNSFVSSAVRVFAPTKRVWPGHAPLFL